MQSQLTESGQRARGLIAEAERVTVLTGAGISTDSGIQDFRGPNGAWTRDPEAERRANIDYYLANPEARKRQWQSRVDSPAWAAEPNPGHRALVELERQGKLHLLVTQNVDGLHRKAGTSPDRLVEIHGTMHEVECWDCGERAPMERALARVRAGEDDPACRSCGGILKSATVMFGQGLVAADLERAELAARFCDLFLVVGSSLVVYPAAGLVPVAVRGGAALVIVNAEETPYDGIADAVVGGSISEVLPLIIG